MDSPGRMVVLDLREISGSVLDCLRAVVMAIGSVAWYGVDGTVTLLSSRDMESLVKSCMIAFVLMNSVPPIIGQ